MKRIIYLPDQLNKNKFKLKEDYRGHGIYQEMTPSGYIVHQEYAVVRYDDNFTFRIESYNSICYDEVLDAIDQYLDTGKYGFNVVQTAKGIEHNYWTVHRCGEKVI